MPPTSARKTRSLASFMMPLERLDFDFPLFLRLRPGYSDALRWIPSGIGSSATLATAPSGRSVATLLGLLRPLRSLAAVKLERGEDGSLTASASETDMGCAGPSATGGAIDSIAPSVASAGTSIASWLACSTVGETGALENSGDSACTSVTSCQSAMPSAHV